MQSSERRPFVVGVAGGSGSGKTTVARKIVEGLPAASVSTIQHDAYYRDRPDLDEAARAAVNYDHPDSLETVLLVEHLQQLRRGHAVQSPIYDFTLHLFLMIVSIYMALALGVNSVRSGTSATHPPWWMAGYALLGLHHYLRLTMFCHAGEHLRRELVKALNLISQFG